MSIFKYKINIENFSIDSMDISDIEEVEAKLPKSGIFDLNIAERGLVLTLEAQNIFKDKIAKIDRYLGFLDSKKNVAWTKAALIEAKAKGYKTAKDKEWFAQADDDFIKAQNEITLAKAAKKWLENKSSYFSGWHYAFKTFLRRDYSIENSTTINYGAYNRVAWGDEARISTSEISMSEEICENGEIDWAD